jgi:hypothetical protein
MSANSFSTNRRGTRPSNTNKEVGSYHDENRP